MTIGFFCLVAVFDDGDSVKQAVVFKSVKEPHLSNGSASQFVNDIVKDHWVVFWTKTVASVDTMTFPKWMNEFIYLTRACVAPNRWIVHFLDALRAHMTTSMISKFFGNKIAVLRLPAHTSNNTQAPDVRSFGSLKHFTTCMLENAAKATYHLGRNIDSLGGLKIWKCIRILHGYDKAVSLHKIAS